VAVLLTTYSRLKFANLVKVSGIEFWDIPDLPDMEPQKDDLLYQVDEFDRFETLAYKFYGDHRLWWVIARRNKMLDVPTNLQTGQVIVIPSRDFVMSRMFKIKR